MPNVTNTLKNSGKLAKVAATMLADKLQFLNTIDKVPESELRSVDGFKPGDTINISKPARYTVGTSFDITSTVQDAVEERTPLTFNVLRNIAINASSPELVYDVDILNYAKRFVEPAVSNIAQAVEQSFIQTASQSVYNYVGTPGANVFDNDIMLAANQKISENLAPSYDDRYCIISPAMNSKMAGARKGLFQSSTNIAEQYKKGIVGESDGFMYKINNLVYNHTTGSATVATNALSANMTNGSSNISVNGLTGSGTVTAGTVLTIAGVNAVHPITKADYGYLQQFVVTANATASSGAATLTVSPTPYTSASGGLQNVTAIANSGAAVVFQTGAASTTRANALGYHKSAFRFASVPLYLPKDVDMAETATVDGVTISIVRFFDGNKRTMVTRLDFLGGFVPVRPEWGTRITA